MRIKTLFIDYYGTLVFEDSDVILKICERIKKTSSYKPDIKDIASFWWGKFYSLCCDSCGSRNNREGCYQYTCCSNKKIKGCWECEEEQCNKGLFSESRDVRFRAFIQYIKENGRDRLAERLYSNMKNGIYYSKSRDYDGLGSIEAVIRKLGE
jgi:hypothetical protein